MKALIDVVHILHCNLNHSYDPAQIMDRQSGVCYYYVEEQIATNSPMPDHLYWTHAVQALKESLSCKTDQELFDLIKDILAATQHLHECMGRSSARKEFVLHILNT
jgi:hypothetical protein